MASKQKASKSPSSEELGVMLKNIYETGYLDRNTAYKMSFLKGVFGGLGGVIGATIVVALLLWVLSIFENIPLLDRVIENLEHTVQTAP